MKWGGLIAANGITGEITNKTHGHALGISAGARGTKLVILTTKDIESLSTVDSLIDLLKRWLLTRPRHRLCRRTEVPRNLMFPLDRPGMFYGFLRVDRSLGAR